ncbi:hypothetical protein T4B_13257 [Trichinella pseudospiralis]|uniref:Uncharacterized protein n=1 Tax=Trichinella pseudospiralis TaxID=6337 RepID=A0A0V1J8H4_TRIPS|nr:hypothetical protein T4B_13257 [Trichinella pseudospiralis]
MEKLKRKEASFALVLRIDKNVDAMLRSASMSKLLLILRLFLAHYPEDSLAIVDLMILIIKQ